MTHEDAGQRWEIHEKVTYDLYTPIPYWEVQTTDGQTVCETETESFADHIVALHNATQPPAGRTKVSRYGNEIPVGDGPCTDCGQGNPFVWWTDNVFWNAVCRTPESGPEPTLCPSCFVKRVFAAGYRPAAFRIIPDWAWQQEEAR